MTIGRLLTCVAAPVAFAALGVTLAAQTALTYESPDGWIASEPSSSMRVAEFTLPRTASDPEDGEAVIYYFQGAGGSIQANLDRWTAQMQQPDERPSSDVAETTVFEVEGMRVTLLDVSGTYVAEMTPGEAGRYDKPDYRLTAAVIETTGGPFFLKVTGPQATMATWSQSIRTFVESMRFE